MNQATLTQLIELADGHQRADEYVAGHYDWDGGACAIGCTIRDAKKIGLVPKKVAPHDHAALAAANGVPELAWRLCDHIFEGLPQADRPAWPPRFLRAIRPDADYTSLPARVMARCAEKLAADAILPEVRAVCEKSAAMWRRRAKADDPTEAEWKALQEQAYAAWQQADAAWQQAYAAWQQAYAAWQQADAAWQQAYAAWQQADAAWQQAYAAWQQADAAWQQAYAARNDFWRWCADMLCEELGATP